MFRKLKEQHILMAPPLLWLIIFLVVPMIIVLGYSLSSTDPGGGLNPGFHLGHYITASDPMYFQIFLRSLGYALASTLLTLALAFPMAYYMAFASPRTRMIMMAMIILPFWTNFLVRMYALMTMLSNSGLINSLLINSGISGDPFPMLNNTFGVYTGFIYWNLPFMILPIFSSLDRMDISQIEASMDLGASHFQTFFHVTLPYSMPGLVAGIIFTFIPTLGNFVIPEFMGGTSNIMIGNVITSQFLQARNWPFGSALSTILMMVVMIFISLYIRFFDPGKSKNMVNF